MTRERFDVAIVGAGLAGSMTAAALAAEDRSSVVLERFDLGHEHGSSHGASRIFRLSYDETHWVEDCVRSLELWRKLESASGRTLLTTTGGFDIGPQAHAHAEAMDAAGVPYSWLSPAEAAERFPVVRFPEGEEVLFQVDAGINHAADALGAAVSVAREAGASIRPATRVLGVIPGDDMVIVDTSAGEIEALAVVVAAGSWAKPLLAAAGIPLDVVVTRETVAYFPVGSEEAVPSIVDWTKDPPFFSLHDPAGRGIKAGWHHAGTEIEDPDVPGAPDPTVIEGLTSWAAERFPSASGPVSPETCLYTTTPDERHVIQRYGRVVVASACSGHGFKFGPLTGERAAALVAEIL